MKIIKRVIFLITLCYLFQCSYALAQNNYSNASIQAYNAGIMYYKQGKYEIAEQKYKQALVLQPNFIEAKENLAAMYNNLANKYYSNANYAKAIFYAKKGLGIQPKDINTYYTLAQSYLSLNDNTNAIISYNKIISLNANEDTAMHELAQIYIKIRQFDKASTLYKKLLLIDPNDKIARNNLNFVNLQLSENKLSESINNLKQIEHIAPERLYRLINISNGLSHDPTMERMKTILDMIWNEPSGQIMLQALIKKNVPINITGSTSGAYALQQKKSETFYIYGVIPVLTIDNSSTSVNIPVYNIKEFNNPSLSPSTRIYHLQVFIHEFGHAFMGVKTPNRKNSVEEEMGVSMLGYNIAYKVITGNYLDKNETKMYSEKCLESLLSDEHRDLPVFSGFDESIQSYGVVLPYPEVYADLQSIYKKLLLEKKVSPVANFENLSYNKHSY